MPKSSDQNFKVFVDEHSPEQSIEADRKWRKQARDLRDRKYTRILLAVVFIMIIILVVLLGVLEGHNPTHSMQPYADGLLYITSSIPHLKFIIMENVDTVETRQLTSLGIVYPEVIEWIEGTVQPNWRVLLVPNQKAGVNVLAIALGYYLNSTSGGKVDILLKDPNFCSLTEQNINQMRKQEGKWRFPFTIISQYSETQTYDLVMIQKNNFHQQVSLNNQRIVLIRREGAQNSIIDTYFSAYQQYQIIRGKTDAKIRDSGKKYGYAIIPYVPSQKSDYNFILLQSNSLSTPPLCPQTTTPFQTTPALRSLVEYLRNKTLIEDEVYYELSDKTALIEIAKLPGIEEIMVTQALKGVVENAVPVSSLATATSRSVQNLKNTGVLYCIIKANTQLTKQLNIKWLILINNEDEIDQYKNHAELSIVRYISPYNANGCFNPPALLSSAPIPPFFLQLSQ